jgi:Repeat of unknown function (DUF5648)
MRHPYSSLLLAVMLSTACTFTTTAPVGYATPMRGDACSAVCGVPMGCRTAVHRMYHGGSGEHFYTTTRGEGVSVGHHEEAANYFHTASSPAPGLVPLHRCLMDYGKHFYTTAPNCEGVTPGHEEGLLGYISPTPQCGAVALYRSYNPRSQDHFYTTSAEEHAHATAQDGYTDEGTTGYVWPSPI